jgi:negative regulator of replication initiation
MRSKEEQRKAVEEARARGAKLGQKHGERINRQLLKTGAVAKSAAAKTAKTAAKGAKKTQELVVKTVHHVMGSDEYKKKATEVNERLAAVVQSLEDSITRRDIEIDRLRKRVAELEGGFRRG